MAAFRCPNPEIPGGNVPLWIENVRLLIVYAPEQIEGDAGSIESGEGWIEEGPEWIEGRQESVVYAP